MAPILAQIDIDCDVIFVTNTSEYICTGVVSQHSKKGIPHPVVFFLTKTSPAECNYGNDNK